MIFGAVIDEGHEDEVRVTVIETGFGPARRRRHRPAAESARVSGEGFEVPSDVLDVPSFLRED